MQNILLMLHVLAALVLIGLILIQHGKGADTGAAFGSGASTTVFGARGSASFLTRATAVLAILFFANSFLLAFLSTKHVERQSLMERVQAEAPQGAAGDDAQQDVPGPAQPAGPADLPDVPAE